MMRAEAIKKIFGMDAIATEKRFGASRPGDGDVAEQRDWELVKKRARSLLESVYGGVPIPEKDWENWLQTEIKRLYSQTPREEFMRLMPEAVYTFASEHNPELDSRMPPVGRAHKEYLATMQADKKHPDFVQAVELAKQEQPAEEAYKYGDYPDFAQAVELAKKEAPAEEAYKYGEDPLARAKRVIAGDNYILFTDTFGPGYIKSQDFPATLARIVDETADYIRANPGASDGDVWLYALRLALAYPSREVSQGLDENMVRGMLQEYINTFDWPQAWRDKVLTAIQDRINAAYDRQQRWDDAYFEGLKAVDEYYKQYQAQERQNKELLNKGIEPEPPKWMEEQDMREADKLKELMEDIQSWLFEYGLSLDEDFPGLREKITSMARQYDLTDPVQFHEAATAAQKMISDYGLAHNVGKKTGGGLMSAGVSLKRLITAAASLGDLVSVLKQVQNPPEEVTKAIKQLEGLLAKYEQDYSEDKVSKETLTKVLNLLKKVPAPTEDRPRTRVQRAIKLIESMLKNIGGGILTASISDVLKLLQGIENPPDEVKQAITLAKQLANDYEEGGAEKYGHIVSVEGLTKLLGMLNKVENKTDEVKKAIAMLKKMLGLDTEKIPEYGNLPSYGVSKLEAAMKPGVYKARLIRAGEALDGKVWTKESLQEALANGLFDGVPLNVITYSGKYGDLEYHLPEDSPLAGSITGNQIGFIKEPWWDDTEDAVYGYAYVTDPSRRELIDTMLSEGVDAPGLSIYAEGVLDGDNVTKIDKVYSMDLVTFPAAGGQILSQTLTAAVKEWGAMQKRLKADAPAMPPAPVGQSPTVNVPENVTLGDVLSWLRAVSNPDALVQKAIVALEKMITKYEQPVHTPTYAGIINRHTGGIMPNKLDRIEKIVNKLDARVKLADTEAMIDQKLAASGLPDAVKEDMRKTLSGKVLTAAEVDSFIKFQQEVVDDLAANLKETGVTLEGGIVEPEGDALEDSLKAYLGIKDKEGDQ